MHKNTQQISYKKKDSWRLTEQTELIAVESGDENKKEKHEELGVLNLDLMLEKKYVYTCEETDE